MSNFSSNWDIYEPGSHTHNVCMASYIYAVPMASLAGGDRGQLGPVPAPDQHGADLPAAAAGDGHAEAAGGLRTAGGAAAQM